uniref:Uncharacterized protein n=2 Tax=Gasterosteus aculeatus aculeatus TaxID=481459 RepID=G3P628_GASAC
MVLPNTPKISSAAALITWSTMNLWLGLHLLLAGLLLSGAAPTPEECRPLITPLSLADPTVMYGRTNLMLGYTDTEILNNILRKTQSLWSTISQSPSSPNTHILFQHNRINGTCLLSKVNLTIDGNTGSSSHLNITSVVQMLPGLEGFLVFSIESTIRDLDKIVRMVNIVGDDTAEELNVRALYLMARETTLKDSDREHFRKQASCLGFSREPDFTHNPDNAFCAEGEGLMIFDATSMNISK